MNKESEHAYWKSSYNKPFFFTHEQIEKLKSHKLNIPDEKYAKNALNSIGYYRFLGYAHHFKRNNDFYNGTSFSQIIELYDFDMHLRSKLIEGIEQIEIWLRAQMGNRLGQYHPFSHRLPTTRRTESTLWRASTTQIKPPIYIDWLEEYSREERRSKGDFVKHHRQKYGPHLPIWAATEIMSFGTLCQLYTQMREEDCSLIAARAGLIDNNEKGDHSTFTSWINHLRHLRNICAHYGRIWNKVFDTSLAAPKPCISELSGFNELPHKLYKSITSIRFLLAHIAPDSDWSTEIRDLICTHADSNGLPLQAMGFPDDWNQAPIWHNTYTADLQKLLPIDYINQIPCISRPDLLKTFEPNRTEKNKKDFLKYLYKNKALILYEFGGTKYYPAFQFSTKRDTINSRVADINEALYEKLSEAGIAPETFVFRIQDWWLSHQPSCPIDTPPIEQLNTSADLLLEIVQNTDFTD